MEIITILLLGVLLVFNLRIMRSFISPAVVTNLIWFILLIIYNTVEHGLYSLSDKFYAVVIIWNTGFSIASILGFKLKYNIPHSMNRLNTDKLGKFMIWIMALCLLISIYGLYLIGNSLNPSNVFAGIRQNSVNILDGGENAIELPFYISIATAIVSYAFIVIGTLLIIREDRHRIVIVSTVLLIIFTLFRSNKSVVVQLAFFFFCLYVLRHGFTKKMLISFIGIFIIMIFAAHLMRAGEEKASTFDFARMITIYLLSPLPAFDYASSDTINLIQDFHGEYTFRAFIPYINLLGYDLIGNSDPFNLHFWTMTPLPVNVYTIFFSFFIDFGYTGIVVASLLYGLFYGILWRGCKKRIPMFQVAYSSCFYILIFQFFSDFLMMFFWSNALILIFIILFYTRFSFGHKKTIQSNYVYR